MHTRHEALFLWLMERFPRSRLYGPYNHGGRSYYQWMARGRTLVDDVLPILEAHLDSGLDGHAAARLNEMRERYAGFIARERARSSGARGWLSRFRLSSLPLGRLADRFGLSEYQAGQLGRFAAILVHDENAPTTVRRPKLVRDDHLADALVALELPVIREAVTIADLGAGPGVPGIPLAIALPRAQVCLVEGNGRKCEFLTHVTELLELGNAEVVHGRAETWKQGLGRFDVVTARALAPLDVVAEYAAPLLRVGGAMVAWRGKREAQVEADAAAGSGAPWALGSGTGASPALQRRGAPLPARHVEGQRDAGALPAP